MEPAIDIRGLGHSFGEGEARKQVLFDNDLEVAAGELVILTGPSGSGKTTLLTLIGALRTVQSGSMRVLGRDLERLDDAGLVRHREDVGFIFQHHNLFPALDAYENVRMAHGLRRLERKERQEQSRAILARLGLAERMHARPQQLSGGQRQRVAIARALVCKPRLILADEPTAALDHEASREVIALFGELVREEGATIVMVTHDSRLLDAANRIVRMIDGRITSDTPTASAEAHMDAIDA